MGFWEFLVVIFVALIVIGPTKLPEVAKTLGALFAKGKGLSEKIKKDLDEQLKIEQLDRNIALAKKAEEQTQENKDES